MTTKQQPYTAVVAVFDGNRRKFPSLLNLKAKRAGCVEFPLVKHGPDEIRILMAKGRHDKFKRGQITLRDGFEAEHKIIEVQFTLDRKRYCVIAFNSGRGNPRAAITKACDAAKAAMHTCDYVIVNFIEFGEGDANKHLEQQIARDALPNTFKQFFQGKRETMFVFKADGGRFDDTFVRVPNTAVRHQSPARSDSLLEIVNEQVLFELWHSEAGAYNGHRAHDAWVALKAGWDRLFAVTRRYTSRYLLKGRVD